MPPVQCMTEDTQGLIYDLSSLREQVPTNKNSLLLILIQWDPVGTYLCSTGTVQYPTVLVVKWYKKIVTAGNGL